MVSLFLRLCGERASSPLVCLDLGKLCTLSSQVTPINARALARERGIDIVETRSTRPRNFTSLISVKLHTNEGEHWVEGAIFEQAGPRLVLLDGVTVEAPLEGSLVVIRNDDRPGVIGEVGTILGRHGINIATLALGRGTDGAVSIYRIDRVPDVKNAVTDTVLSDLDGIDAVTSAGLVVLP